MSTKYQIISAKNNFSASPKKVSRQYTLKSIEEDEEEKDNVYILNAMNLKNQIINHEEINEQLANLFSKESPVKQTKGNTKFDKTKYSSKGSFLEFYSKMHKVRELQRKGDSLNHSPSFTFIQAAKKYKIIQNPVGIIKRHGEEGKVNLSHKRMGDNYVMSLAHSLKASEHLTELNLSDNRLTNTSIIPLLKTIADNPILCRRISNLNLGYNKLGPESVNQLCCLIDQVDCEMTHVNLESNVLGNILVINLLNAISQNLNTKIKYLNLGQNNLDDESSYNFANFITICVYLEVLILHSNAFKNFGGSQIVAALRKHQYMKVFDISWNLIGSNLTELVPTRDEVQKANKDPDLVKNCFNIDLYDIMTSMEVNPNFLMKKKLNPLRTTVSLFAKELGELFKEKDCELVHLDISHNNINSFDSAFLAETVINNHTILGIHCDGNEMTIDELGFISPLAKSDYGTNHYASSQIYYKIDKEHPLIKSNIVNTRKIRAKNNCWICEGWKETKFIYKPQYIGGELEDVKINLHLSFENYKPFEAVHKVDHFVCHRMCPPGETLFYYTVNGLPVENYGQNLTHMLKDAIVHTETNEEENTKQQHIVTKVAKIHAEINPNVIDSNTYKKLVKNCVPRPDKKINKKVRARTPWVFPISIWALYDYKQLGDSEEYIDDAFECDFARCQFTKDAKTPENLNALRVVLRGYYRQLVDCYRYYASLLGSNLWQINKNYLLEFCNACPNLLGEGYLFNDVLLQFTTVINSPIDKEDRTKNKNKNLPDNIVRHQFLNLLVKISKDKYTRNKTFDNIVDAVKHSFDNHYFKVIKNYDIHKWRVERYYNELVDNVIKAYLPVFDGVFKSQASVKEIGRRE